MFVSKALSSYPAAVQLCHKSSRFHAPDTVADIIIAYRDLELHSMFCPILLPPLRASFQSASGLPPDYTFIRASVNFPEVSGKVQKKANQDLKKFVDIFKKVLAFQKHIAYNNTCVTENDIHA